MDARGDDVTFSEFLIMLYRTVNKSSHLSESEDVLVECSRFASSIIKIFPPTIIKQVSLQSSPIQAKSAL